MAYEPSNLGEYSVHAAKRNTPTPKLTLGRSPLSAIDAEPGDTVVCEETEDGLLITVKDDE